MPRLGLGSGLPENWRRTTDGDGKQYYYHTVTRASTYDVPPRLPQGWHVTRHPQSKVLYFYNSLTRKTLPFGEAPPGGEAAVAALKAGLGIMAAPEGPPPIGPPPGPPPMLSPRSMLSSRGMLSPRGGTASNAPDGSPAYAPQPPRHLQMDAETCNEHGIRVDKLEGQVGVKVISMVKPHGALSVGDDILSLNGQKLESAEDCHTIMKNSSDDLTFVISRENDPNRERTHSAVARLKSATALRVTLFAARLRGKHLSPKAKMNDRMSDYI